MQGQGQAGPAEQPAGASERIVAAACELFARRGVRDVGIEELIRASGVAKATFYRHFRSKDEVVLAYLDQWYWERSEAIDAAVARNAAHEGALLAVFDVFDFWFRHGRAEVITFVQVMMEMGREHPLGRASIDYMEGTRRQLAQLAAAADLDDPDDFAWSMHILIKGAIVAAAEGDPHAASRARTMAALLIDAHARS
ncbi:TetR/AcrR family transcriptional regulator [Sinomonas humi]|uniref:TetR family transcriptional regulator n=1 Tax=Sinomonas humi TaxID=1338436 RepID=A0A0B2AES4_9MICC|nr:TetR/AcrR family transcriptional regulator [Sinomonas humi]KHL00303.1 TetR family transcriptional regulator [Sinomonas humi]